MQGEEETRKAWNTSDSNFSFISSARSVREPMSGSQERMYFGSAVFIG